jgi:hypothetical protein
MKKWMGLLALLLVWGVIGGIAFADGADYPAVVVNNHDRDDLLPLYAQPRSNAQRLGEYPNGTTAWLLEDEGDWSLVRLGDGTEGYFQTNRLMNMEGLTGLVPLERAKQWGLMVGAVDLPALLLYDYPLADAPTSEVPMEMRKTIAILKPFGTWYHVRLEDGREGYMLCQDLEVMSTLTLDEMRALPPGIGLYATIVNPDSRDRLHLREEPSRSSTSLGRYFNGTQLMVLDTLLIDDVFWMYVRVDGKEGYMMSPYTCTLYGQAPEWGNG